MPSAVDPRLRAAVDASLAWYDALLALHGVGGTLRDGLWWANRQPPPLHSAVKTVEPGVAVSRVVDALAQFEHGSVADSFGDYTPADLSGSGFELLFEARWLFRDAHSARPNTLPAGWSPVRTVADLAEWTARHDTSEVLLPGLLERSSFSVLGRRLDDELVAGAVVQLCTGVVHVSNCWGQQLDWAELIVAAAALHPGRPLVGYERGADLDSALAAGFVDVGPHLVWVR